MKAGNSLKPCRDRGGSRCQENRKVTYTYEQVAKTIDTSLLNPGLDDQALEEGCRIALKYNAASACVMPFYLKKCAEILAGSTVKASTTIGFPHGGHTTDVKVAEAKQALADGGEELDMVVNISKVLSGDWDYVRKDIQAVVDLVRGHGQKSKIIFENCYLNDEQKIRLCEICADLNPDWVKTSTGYAHGGATIDDLKLMRAHSPEHIQVKAAGGIRTLDALLEVMDLGVTRVGSTRTVEFCEQYKERIGK